MKGIGFILLFFSFGTPSLLGLPSNIGKQQATDSQPSSNYKHRKFANDVLLAQGSTAQETDPIVEPQPKTELGPPTQEGNAMVGDEHLEQIPPNGAAKQTPQIQVVDSEKGESIKETDVAWEKTRRIFKVVNDYELAPDEVLTTLVIIAGNVKLLGSITGNALVLGGNVELASGAQVNGTLHLIGGQVTGNMEGIADLQVSNRWQMVPAAVRLIMHPHALWNTNKETSWQLTLVKFGLFLIMYLLVVTIFPRPVNAVSTLLTNRPIGSILFSILMLVVIPMIIALLTFSIVGVPFMLLGLSALLPLAICGKAAIFLALGSTLFSGRLKPLAVIFGYLLYFMATALPYIDWITFLIINTIGIGICFLSGINLMRSQDTRRNISAFPGNEWGSRSERV